MPFGKFLDFMRGEILIRACQIQECIDAAYAGEEDYRQRVYTVGGYLNVNKPPTS